MNILGILKKLFYEISALLVCFMKSICNIWCDAVEAYKSVWDTEVIHAFIGWAAICFMVFYVFFVLVFWHVPLTCPSLINIFLASGTVFVIISYLFKLFKGVLLRDTNIIVIHGRLWKTCLWIFSAYTCYILLIGYYDSPDTIVQWEQVLKGKFDDWHPVMHTFTIYLLQRVFHYHVFVVLAFMAFFAHACGWLYATLRNLGYRRNWSIFVIALITLSPVSMSILRVLWKDTEFGISVLYLSVFLIQFWHNGGKDLCRWQWILFIGILVYASFVRHNGFFFTVPLLVFLPFMEKERYRRIRLGLFSILVFACMGGYVFFRTTLKNNGVITQNIPQTFGESVGIPMCIMSKIMVEAPEEMPRDAYEFMLRICPQEDWYKYYEGDFNSVKFPTHVVERRVFDTITPKDFFSMFIQSIMACKRTTIDELIHITSLGIDPFWSEIRYESRGKQILFFKYASLLFQLENKGLTYLMMNSRWGWLMMAPGFSVLLLIVLGTYAFLKHGYRVLAMVTPFLSYTWGTTLLLTGWDHRFFYGILIGSVPIVLVLLGSHQKID